MQLRTQYSRILIIGIIIILAIVWYLFATRIPFVESTFDNGHGNWLVSGDAESGLPNYSTDGGNPGGFIYAEDKAVGGVWYWFAPEKFYGNRSSYYGQHLSFELKQSATKDQFDDDDIILVAGKMQLVYKTAKNSGLQWTSYKVVLGESAGWINKNTGKDATKEEIYNVLAHLNGLYIRGEYVVGDDVGSLDNVHFGQLP